MQGGELPLFVCECDRSTRHSAILDGVPPQRYPVSLSGRKNIRHHRVKRSENSSQSSEASESAIVHVEDCRPTFHWKVGLVCACRQTLHRLVSFGYECLRVRP